jgi:hypothetical protein
VRIMPADHLGSRVKEAVSESFTVRDHRGECKFHYNLYRSYLIIEYIFRIKYNLHAMIYIRNASPIRWCINTYHT